MLKSGSLCLLSIATVFLTGCPLPPYGDAPPHGCQGPGCYDDDDDDDGCGGWGGKGGYGGGGGYAGGGGKAGSGGGGLPLRTPMALDEYQQRLRLDLATVPRAQQAEAVYVEFHAAYNNPNYTDGELGVLVNATFKLLNQLDVLTPFAASAGSVVTDDFGRPIAVRFNPSRFNLDKQRDIVDAVVRLARRQDVNDPFSCDVPAVPGLDFLHLAANDDVFDPIFQNFESVYSNVALRKLLVNAGILGPDQLVFDPVSEAQFLANGVTNVANVTLYDALAAVDPVNFNRATLDLLYNDVGDRERLVRGCLLQSNVSAGNRCIDRLTQSSPSNGATYLTFDVLAFNNADPSKDFFAAAFVGPGNPAGDPLVRPHDGIEPFAIDGGVGIYQLPNSMLGFLGFNANFQLVSNALPYNLSPFDGNTPASSATCNSCHAGFAIPFKDAIKDAIEFSPGGPLEFSYILKRSQDQEAWDATFEIDAASYTDALRQVYFVRPEDGFLGDAIGAFSEVYKRDLSPLDAAAELGLPDADAFLDVLDNLDLDGEFSDGVISRESFVLNYQALVDQVASSEPDFLRGCVVRDTSDVGDSPTGD
ncbi:MAG TPA: hypothetical protein VFS43_19660 [Polyangiaceae bacterium]|nr:hypothetical protein [Polyangiaceae bacterium]